MKKLKVLPAMLVLVPVLACADEEPLRKVSNTTLIQSSTSWDGGSFAYPEGTAQITMSRIIVPEGVALPMHCHPVPLAGTVVKGRLLVTKANGESRVFSKGDSVIEVSNTGDQPLADISLTTQGDIADWISLETSQIAQLSPGQTVPVGSITRF